MGLEGHVETILFLILFPAGISLLLLSIPVKSVRRLIAVIANIALIAGTIHLLYESSGATVRFELESVWIERAMLVLEAALSVYILYMGVRFRRYLVVLFTLLQLGLLIHFETVAAPGIHVVHSLFADNFSIILALIIGIIGSFICLYAIGYIEEYHERHKESEDNRRVFFFLMYLFLSAMFGIVFSNNLKWIYFFWEVTTVCSFLLIKYHEDEESIDSAFSALTMNLLGGLAFAAGISYAGMYAGTLELDRLIADGGAYAVIPAALIAFAGLAKSAQLPFSSWLTKAMVAPTPVSALLHSSTMVKAGVYIIIKVAPALKGTLAAAMLSYLGGLTFLVTSLIAISQSNAKKVLAYSTIGNLGLVVACAGIGTNEAVWSAILLIVFHAVAKSLMFLCVGITEHKLSSKEIENMDFLIMEMPKVSAAMIIGISGMFLAPFGMLISKWATLKAFIDFNPVMAIILAYGSAATLFFWTKWMGKIITIKYGLKNLEKVVSPWEWTTLAVLSFMTIGVCIVFPVLSSALIEPYITEIFGASPSMDRFNIIIIMIIMLGLLTMLPVALMYYAWLVQDYMRVGTYLGGANVDNARFLGSTGAQRTADIRNYYLENFFSEKRLFDYGWVAAVFLVILMLGVVIT